MTSSETKDPRLSVDMMSRMQGAGDFQDMTNELIDSVKKIDINGQSSPHSHPQYHDFNNTPQLMKNSCKSTHNNIFGESCTSPQKTGKVYHMSSDIFGLGALVDRDGQHVKSRPIRRDCKVSTSPYPNNVMSYDTLQQRDMTDSQSEDRVNGSKSPNGMDYKKSNARENGCNPVTGAGYTDGDVGKSQRKQYPSGRSQSLW